MRYDGRGLRNDNSAMVTLDTLEPVAVLLLLAAGCGSDPRLVSDIDPASADQEIIQYCPELLSVEVSPLQTGVGEEITLSARAADANGDSLAFRWTTSKGAIHQANSADARYVCEAQGSSVVKLSVSDGHGCQRRETVLVTCR